MDGRTTDRRTDGQIDAHTDDQCETIITRHYVWRGIKIVKIFFRSHLVHLLILSFKGFFVFLFLALETILFSRAYMSNFPETMDSISSMDMSEFIQTMDSIDCFLETMDFKQLGYAQALA